ncbi:metallophosphoesterase family protein [Lactobacillus ultunensis]|uniref:Ser/Thr phosphatase family protein n=1 Tax=Lactobacillus ultunensis DSM 16047 TaxID=525365 RepID=C2ELH8_9LACO|nr:metallophosphoesterase family protein [Lactobacillus ultunensis]EEJ72626.1 Ser/Thr phosphatase family protein [Lactobacillus ultunensis DSM 16047]QQP28178.1 serine/threonine protein phosphatase [Lactobacillus ultunensis]
MTQNIINRTLLSDRTRENYIFISDIHGNLETLGLIEQAKKDFPAAQLVTGGDYIDGRKNVKEVLDYLIEQKSQGAIVLLGNHEQMMLNFADNCEHQDGIWFYNGGNKTLLNLFDRIVSRGELRDSRYYRFLKSCPIMYETPHLIFVHAGVRPDKEYNDPATYNEVSYGLKFDYDFFRVWARDRYWYSNMEDEIFAHNQTGKTIVTGHTPTAGLEGKFDDGRKLGHLSWDHCVVRMMQYPGESARIFTDGGSHSDPMIYPHNDGNVVVLNNVGKIIRVYNWDNPNGTEFINE